MTCRGVSGWLGLHSPITWPLSLSATAVGCSWRRAERFLWASGLFSDVDRDRVIIREAWGSQIVQIISLEPIRTAATCEVVTNTSVVVLV